MLRYIAQARARGLGVVFITHNVHHAYPIGDRFTLLNRGTPYGTFSKSEVTPGRGRLDDGRRRGARRAGPRAGGVRPRGPRATSGPATVRPRTSHDPDQGRHRTRQLEQQRPARLAHAHSLPAKSSTRWPRQDMRAPNTTASSRTIRPTLKAALGNAGLTLCASYQWVRIESSTTASQDLIAIDGILEC